MHIFPSCNDELLVSLLIRIVYIPGCVGRLLWCERLCLFVFSTLPRHSTKPEVCVPTGRLWLARVHGSPVEGCHRGGTVSRAYEESEQYG
jgi:hypothetical protein